MEVEVDVASVGYEDSVADVVQSLLLKLLELLEKARLEVLSASCSSRRSEGFGWAYNVEDDSGADEVEAVGVDQTRRKKMEAINVN